MRIKKDQEITYIEDKQRHMTNNKKSRRKPKGQENNNSSKYL